MEEGVVRKFRATAEQWQAILGEYTASGKSIRRFSRERGIPHTQLTYYLCRARKAEAARGFIELRRESPGKLWIEAGSSRIHVERGFDAVLLRQVAEALS